MSPSHIINIMLCIAPENHGYQKNLGEKKNEQRKLLK